MKRLFAYRPILFTALFLCFGILTAFFGFISNTLAFLLCIIPTSIFAIILIVSALLEKHKFKFENLKLKNIFAFLCKFKKLFAICLCVFVFGFALFHISVQCFESNKIDKQNCRISGVVTKCITQKDTYTTFYLRDCVAKFDEKQDNLDGLVKVTTSVSLTSFPQEMQLGKHISFNTTIESVSILYDESTIDTFSYKFSIKYTCNLTQSNLSSVVMADDGATLAEQVNQNVLQMLKNNMSLQNAYLAWSVLFGDSTLLSNEAIEAFKVSGVMHIIAVSGMNVVFIIAILLGFFKLIRLKRKSIQFVVVVLFLGLYCYLCAWTPSVVRASIMAVVFLAAKFSGKNGDVLSNLALTAIIILVLQPLMLFEPGFLLSFVCLLGIVLIEPPLQDFMTNKCKFPKMLAVACATTLSASIAIYPVLATFFGYVSTYSLLANLVIVPVFEFAYSLLFVIILVASILPFVAPALGIIEVLFSFINWFPTLFVNLPNSVLYVFSLGGFALLFYVLLLVVSRFTFFTKKVKIWTSLTLVAMLVCFVGLSYIPNKNLNNAITNLAPTSGQSVFIKDKNETFLIGTGTNIKDSERLKNTLYENKIFSFDNLVLWSDNSTTKIDEQNALELANIFSVKKFLLSKDYSAEHAFLNKLKNQNIEYVILPEFAFYAESNLKLRTLCYENKSYSLQIEVANQHLFLQSRVLTQKENNEYKALIDEYEYENYVEIKRKTYTTNQITQLQGVYVTQEYDFAKNQNLSLVSDG